jgi:hypothetical protein
MWPVYVAAMVAAIALAVGLVSGVAGRRRAEVGWAVAMAVWALVAVAMYGVTEARYHACVDDGGLAEGAEVALVGQQRCYRRVFGGVRGDVVR